MNRAAPALLLVVVLAGCLGSGPSLQEDKLVWPFPEIVGDGDVDTFVLWAEEVPAPYGDGLAWIETHLGKDALGHYAGPGIGDLRVVPAPDGPRFGMDGYNATRATLMVFNDEAELLATTAGLDEYAHLPWILDSMTPIEDALYYLGDNGTAPDGTKPLPRFMEAFKPRIVELLSGLPVGGVATAIIPEEEYRDAFGGFGLGTLYLTARVDVLAQAP